MPLQNFGFLNLLMVSPPLLLLIPIRHFPKIFIFTIILSTVWPTFFCDKKRFHLILIKKISYSSIVCIFTNWGQLRKFFFFFFILCFSLQNLCSLEFLLEYQKMLDTHVLSDFQIMYSQKFLGEKVFTFLFLWSDYGIILLIEESRHRRKRAEDKLWKNSQWVVLCVLSFQHSRKTTTIEKKSGTNCLVYELKIIKIEKLFSAFFFLRIFHCFKAYDNKLKNVSKKKNW